MIRALFMTLRLRAGGARAARLFSARSSVRSLETITAA
jgi:hypothetical protein